MSIGYPGDNPDSPQDLQPETIEVTETNVHEIEQLLIEVLPPRKLPTDILVKKYFEYLIREKRKIQDLNSLAFPFVFYDGPVANLDELKEKNDKCFRAIEKVIQARGRGGFGKIGDHFWTNSKVPDLYITFANLGRESDRVWRLLSS